MELKIGCRVKDVRNGACGELVSIGKDRVRIRCDDGRDRIVQQKHVSTTSGHPMLADIEQLDIFEATKLANQCAEHVIGRIKRLRLGREDTAYVLREVLYRLRQSLSGFEPKLTGATTSEGVSDE